MNDASLCGRIAVSLRCCRSNGFASSCFAGRRKLGGRHGRRRWRLRHTGERQLSLWTGCRCPRDGRWRRDGWRGGRGLSAPHQRLIAILRLSRLAEHLTNLGVKPRDQAFQLQGTGLPLSPHGHPGADPFQPEDPRPQRQTRQHWWGWRGQRADNRADQRGNQIEHHEKRHQRHPSGDPQPIGKQQGIKLRVKGAHRFRRKPDQGSASPVTRSACQ